MHSSLKAMLNTALILLKMFLYFPYNSRKSGSQSNASYIFHETKVWLNV
jgi:hypothetical protein